MTRESLKNRLGQGAFILDGGMGSQLIARQVVVKRCNDALNLDDPDVIEAIHRDYIDAGSNAILTNTFGAGAIPLTRYGLADHSAEICTAAAEIARRAAGPDRYVIGDIGPCGEFLEPLGTLKPEALHEAVTIQAQALLKGGVDGFIVETMTAVEEISCAVKAVQAIAPDLPVLMSMAFDVGPGGTRTMMGVDAAQLVNTAKELGVTAVGFNCGTATLEEYEQLGKQLVEAAQNSDLLVYGEPNAGKPVLEGTESVYKVTPAEFADTAERLCEMGVRILGGCCGTGPGHIEAVAKRLC